MTQDLGSGIGEIRYNPYNLPTTLIKSGQTYQYRYDGSGKRIEKVQPNGSFESYRRGANGELFAIYDNLGALKQFELDGMGEARFVTGDAQQKSSSGATSGNWQFLYYDKDLFGNIRSTIAQNGTTERTYDADSWGYEYEAKQGRISKTYDEKFLGNPRDRETGFDFTGVRLYESRLGLFLGAEPLYDELHSVSPFSYGMNNPLKFVDKDGNNPLLIGALVGAGVEIASQVITSIANDDPVNINWTQVGIASGAGALSGGLSLIKNVGTGTKILKELGEIALDIAESASKQAVVNQGVDGNNVAIGVVSGVGGRWVGGNLGKKAQEDTENAVLAGQKESLRLRDGKRVVEKTQGQINKEASDIGKASGDATSTVIGKNSTGLLATPSQIIYDKTKKKEDESK